MRAPLLPDNQAENLLVILAPILYVSPPLPLMSKLLPGSVSLPFSKSLKEYLLFSTTYPPIPPSPIPFVHFTHGDSILIFRCCSDTHQNLKYILPQNDGDQVFEIFSIISTIQSYV